MKANQYVEGESSQWPPPGSFFLTCFEDIPLNGIDAAMYFEFDGGHQLALGTLEVRFPNSRFNPLNHVPARLGIFEVYDGIACFVDKSSGPGGFQN